MAVPDEVHRQARIRAAELGTSVSALVRGYLSSLSGGEVEFRRLEAQQRRFQDEIDSFRGGDRLDRDQVHGPAVH